MALNTTPAKTKRRTQPQKRILAPKTDAEQLTALEQLMNVHGIGVMDAPLVSRLVAHHALYQRTRTVLLRLIQQNAALRHPNEALDGRYWT